MLQLNGGSGRWREEAIRLIHVVMRTGGHHVVVVRSHHHGQVVLHALGALRRVYVVVVRVQVDVVLSMEVNASVFIKKKTLWF